MKKQNDIIDGTIAALNGFLEENGLPKAECGHSADSDVTAICLVGERLAVLDVTAMPAAKIVEECALRGRERTLAIAPFFPPVTADKLCAEHINYADTAGNLRLFINGNLLCVKNCPRPARLVRQVTPGRCWNPQGMKVLFLLLTENDALGWTYREIADRSGVSLGTVNNVLLEALERRYLLKWDNGYRWGDKARMVDLWVANYALILLPRLTAERYQGNPIAGGVEGLLLPGGETAAAEAGLADTTFGQYWKQGNIAPVIARNRWHPDADGNITVKSAFWPEDRPFKRQVPWLLVYADLMAVDDSRIQEIANEFKAKHTEI